MPVPHGFMQAEAQIVKDIEYHEGRLGFISRIRSENVDRTKARLEMAF